MLNHERKINLRKIFINSKFNKIPLTLEEEDIVLNGIDTWYTIEDIEKAMLDFGKQLLELASNKAGLCVNNGNVCYSEHIESEVNKETKERSNIVWTVHKQSILDVIKLVE